MKLFIVQFPFGVAAFDENNGLVEKALFPKKAQDAAKSLLKTESGKLSDQVSSLISLLASVGYDTFAFESAKLAEEAQKKMKIAVEVAKPAETAVLHARMGEVAIESGFAKDEQELSVWNRSVSLELAKLRIKGATGKRDLIVAQGIQTLDSLDQTVNLFMGRLREWYGVYFPSSSCANTGAAICGSASSDLSLFGMPRACALDVLTRSVFEPGHGPE